MKQKIFIGSSVESLPLARAVQAELTREFEVTIWTQGIFKLSNNTLEDLINALDKFDFGIFVFSPDDILKIRNRKYKAVRDNVIFEFGLFIGRLGSNRVYFLVPDECEDLHLPSDLLGITSGKYFERSDNNLRAAVSPFCDEVRDIVLNTELDNCGLIKSGMFQEFNDSFVSLTNSSKELALFFIHSRSWRENNHNVLENFLNRPDSKKLYAFLPNFLNEQLVNSLSNNFEDGKYIPSLIEDAVSFFIKLRDKHPRKVVIKLFNFYPTYSFYKFDNSVIFALYPTTDRKKNVPTFEVSSASKFLDFVADDFNALIDNSVDLTKEHEKKL